MVGFTPLGATFLTEFFFATGLPLDEVEESSHVAMLLTSRGGHIGFMEGLLPNFNANFYSERVIEQYLQALYRLSDIRRDLH